jgi:hypothetical protein
MMMARRDILTRVKEEGKLLASEPGELLAYYTVSIGDIE